jgi:hypothetical protein
MLAETFGVGQVLWSILWLFIFVLWFMLLFQVTLDIFRSHDLSGAAKALWILFILIIPYLGVFVYLVARGGKMHEHQIQAAEAQKAVFDHYIQTTAGGGQTAAQQLNELADLRDRGVIEHDEFARLKAKIIG